MIIKNERPIIEPIEFGGEIYNLTPREAAVCMLQDAERYGRNDEWYQHTVWPDMTAECAFTLAHMDN